MTQHDWNAHYASNELPWDTGEPEQHLVEWVTSHGIAPGRALEIGCGTGTNALWLAAQGFDVLAVDLAELAIERARAKATAAAQKRCEFQARDFLAGAPITGAFQLVFDRGCFHVFDDADERARFASRVASVLAPGGMWLSLIGSTEGAAREMGPPRRSARDIVGALEPWLELLSLRAIEFGLLPGEDVPPKAWFCLSRQRELPAQPSTRRADA